MSLAEGRVNASGFWRWFLVITTENIVQQEQSPNYQPMRFKSFAKEPVEINGPKTPHEPYEKTLWHSLQFEKHGRELKITDSGQRKVKEEVKTVLKVVVRGDEATVDAAEAEADLDGIGIVTGAVLQAIKKAEVPADWGWEGRQYEIAVAEIMDVDNHVVWEMPHNFSRFGASCWKSTLASLLHGFYFNRQVGVQDWGVPESKTRMPLTKPEKQRMIWARTTTIVLKWAIGYTKKLDWEEGGGLGARLEGVVEYPKAAMNVSYSGLKYDKLLEATEEGEMVACHNPRDESHWEDYNLDASKPNHEEHHYYKHEMIFVSPKDNEETLEVAAATLPGVPRESWNQFHTRKEQESTQGSRNGSFQGVQKVGCIKGWGAAWLAKSLKFIILMA
ncbi:hypothetical protein BPAE_0157g00130 [Botrytis paeoniae]|uniref:Uncharacterized protein n=1 Tax=Botrytis paeoniae TaxID=278948 RepID=A0A4Z1FDR3_9HELO|nr:hypothetical protein BPAE_0157g00130 [Botrytis paeoniae]